VGKGHPSYVLYARRRSRRLSIYVPGDLAPAVQRAVQNGRRLQEIVNEAGVRFVQALKREKETRMRKR
jgi:hypothetical protein